VSSSEARIQLGNEAVITAELFRNVGKPTENTIVTYSAVTAAGAAVGLFSDVQPTNIEGVSTATFSPGDSAPLGPVTIRVSAGGSVVGTTVVELVQP
jgi:hypothetical protein